MCQNKIIRTEWIVGIGPVDIGIDGFLRKVTWEELIIKLIFISHLFIHQIYIAMY